MYDRHELVLAHMGLAEKIAASKKKKVPNSVRYEDLKAAAYLGLVEAAQKYEEDKNVEFKYFAAFRISGAIKDYLRECGWGPRDDRKSVMSLDAPQDEDGNALVNNLEDTRHVIKMGDLFERMTYQLSSLAKNVLKLYYVDGMKMRQIAVRYGITEGRVSQIVSQTKGELRETWASQEHELWAEVA